MLSTRRLLKLCGRALCVLEKNRKHSTKPAVLGKVFRTLDGAADTSCQQFQENLEFGKGLAAKYEQLLSAAQAGGGEKAIERHTKRNKKLLVSERLRLFLDEDEEFFELSPLAGMGMEYGDIPRAGVVTGIGKVHGIHCMIIANDATVKAGTIYPISLKKQLRAQEIAYHNRLPCIYVVDSGGAFLPLQADIFPETGGKTFYNEAILSSLDVPQVAIVCGSCTAGGAYVPCMAQEAVIVDKLGHIFLGGPPLVYAALGEVVTPEDLGGGLLHSSVSGDTDYFAKTEQEAFSIGRDIVVGFNWCPNAEPDDYDDPVFDPEELQGLVPVHNQHEMDMYQVLARITDGSRFNEFKAMYGTTLITGFAYVQGYLVGIVTNQGSLTEQAAIKGAHFVQICCQRNIPLVFLQNATPDVNMSTTADLGEMLGCRLRNHAKFMGAVACAKVPKITFIVGGSYGATNYLMGGRAFDPRFLFNWPNAQVAITEPSQLIQEVLQEKFPHVGKEDAQKYEEHKEKLSKQIIQQAGAMYSSTRMLDDGIVLPQQTRQVLGQCLRIISQSQVALPSDFSVLRM